MRELPAQVKGEVVQTFERAKVGLVGGAARDFRKQVESQNLATSEEIITQRRTSAMRIASRGGFDARSNAALAAELDRFGAGVRLREPVAEADAEGVTTEAGERLEGTVVIAAALGEDRPRTRVRLATIVLDAPELAEAPRGTGVLVAPEAPGIAARALTHLSAKWPWLAERTPLQLLRLSYDADVEVTAALAHRDAQALLGRSLPAPIEVAVVEWERAGRRAGDEHADDGMFRTGESESGTGLAAVIAHAEAVARQIPRVDPGRGG